MKKNKIAHCKLKSLYGEFELYCFNFGKNEDANVLVLLTPFDNKTPTIRIQSACFTAEIFRSTDCDCHEQLITSLNIIQNEGGLLIYLLQDGRGAGIFKKVQGLSLSQEKGLDTAEAYDELGITRDPRSYLRVIEILKYFKINSVKLLTNNPRKMDALIENNIYVERVPLEIKPTKDSKFYLETKRRKLGHLLTKYF